MKSQYLTKEQIFEGVEHFQNPIKMGWNTWLYQNSKGERVLRYTFTDIVKQTPNGDLIFNTGGWRTATTKRKINEFLLSFVYGSESQSNKTVFQNKGQWFLGQRGKKDVIPFFDGLQLTPDGAPIKTAENIQEAIIDATFNKLDEHFTGIEYECVHDLCEEAFSCKEQISKLLGLNEGNEFRHIFPVEMDSTYFESQYPQTNRLFKLVSEGKNFDVIENTIEIGNGQKMKLSRFLARNKNKVDEQDDCIKRNVCEELEIGSINDLSIFRDKIKPKMCVISTNPYDIITSTENSSYRSCYRFDGEYFNSTLALCRTPNVAIVYLYDKDITRKIGRSWVYLFPDALKFIMLKSYGSFYEGERKAAREYIEFRLSKHYRTENRWKISKSINYENVTGHCDPVYFDSHEVTKVRHCTANEEQERVNLPPALCLYCGDETEHQSGGGCSGCGSSYSSCSDCGCDLDEGEVYSDDYDDYCNDCFNERYFYCENCDHRTSVNEECYVDGVGSYCDECYSNHYVRCDGCDVDLDRDGGNYFCPEQDCGTYCEECYDERYTRCNNCEGETEKSEAKEHDCELYCEDCYESMPIECEHCGDEVENRDTKELNGSTFCEDCHSEILKEELEHNLPGYGSQTLLLPEQAESLIQEQVEARARSSPVEREQAVA